MARELYGCTMANTNGTADKVWAAVVLKHTSGQDAGFYQYGAAWGRHNGHISSKLQKPEFKEVAIERYVKTTREKASEGYLLVAPNYDTGLKIALDYILLDQTMVEQAATTVTPKETITKPRPTIPLPDLPCTASSCGHYLNSHAARTQTPEVGGRVCLVITCKCEQYRRYCFECGFTSVTAWYHTTDCVTGQNEKNLSKPQEDKPTITKPTIYVRQPRRIMHLISDDDD